MTFLRTFLVWLAVFVGGVLVGVGAGRLEGIGPSGAFWTFAAVAFMGSGAFLALRPARNVFTWRPGDMRALVLMGSESLAIVARLRDSGGISIAFDELNGHKNVELQFLMYLGLVAFDHDTQECRLTDAGYVLADQSRRVIA